MKRTRSRAAKESRDDKKSGSGTQTKINGFFTKKNQGVQPVDEPLEVRDVEDASGSRTTTVKSRPLQQIVTTRQPTLTPLEPLSKDIILINDESSPVKPATPEPFPLKPMEDIQVLKRPDEVVDIENSSCVLSPPKPMQVHPFFAWRQPVEKKQPAHTTPRLHKVVNRSLPSDPPWLTVHCRPPMEAFSASPHSFPLRASGPSTSTTTPAGLFQQLLQSATTSPDFLRNPEPNPLHFVPPDRAFDGSPQNEKATLLSTLPPEHVSHPAIRRLLVQDDEVPSTAVHQMWTDKYAPKRAEEMLFNIQQTIYLREWLKALELRLDSPAYPSATAPGEENEPPLPAKRPLKRPRPVIQRAVEKKYKRRKTGKELERWMVADDDDDELEGYWSAEGDTFEGISSPSPRSSSSSSLTLEPVLQGTRSRPRRVNPNVVVCSPPDTTDTAHAPPTEANTPLAEGEPTPSSSTPYDFADRLTNTILLSGPNGSGKTAAVFACAAELGWDVFEVYSGIGKRSGAAVNALVGDVGTNHIVGGPSIPNQGLAGKRDAFATLFGGPPKTHADRQNSVGYVTSSQRTLAEHDMEEDGPPTTTVRQSLILLEEVDILYQADSNFWPTVINLIKNSRRPVIMTCNDVALVPVKDLPLQDHLIFTPCDVGLASTYLQVLALVESGFVRSVGRASVEKVYKSTCAPLSADTPDQPMHPIPSQPPLVPDLKRAMNQFMFWCAGSRSQPAHLGPPQPGNRRVPRQGTGEDEGEGGYLLEVLGDWSAAPALLAYLGIQTSEGQDDGMIPDDRGEYGDLCGAYSMVESLSFADAFLDRRDLRVLEAGSIDRYTASADDEIGYTLLAKRREKEEAVGIAWVERDECMGQEVVYRARMKLEEGRVGERLREYLHNTPTVTGVDMTAQGGRQREGNFPTDALLTVDDAWRFNARRLAMERAAFQTRVVGGLDEVPVVLSGPLLPRPGMTVDYLPWIRAMVRMRCEYVGSGKHWADRLSREGREGLC